MKITKSSQNAALIVLFIHMCDSQMDMGEMPKNDETIKKYIV